MNIVVLSISLNSRSTHLTSVMKNDKLHFFKDFFFLEKIRRFLESAPRNLKEGRRVVSPRGDN